MKIDKLWMMSLGLVLPLAGCPGDDDGPTDSGANTTTSTTGDTTVDPTGGTVDTTVDPTTEPTSDTVDPDSTGEPPEACLGTDIGTAAVGDACSANSACASGVCTIYTDVPLNDDAVCAETPENCGVRVTGTIFDFTTREPLSGANLIVAAALQAATNPTMAMALVEDTSGANGRVDATSASSITAPIGIVALVSAGGYFLTATGVAAPAEGSSYNVGTNIHDIWAVPAAVLGDWSDALGDDPEIPATNLPLGGQGGVVGLVRDAAGQPISGATVASTNAGTSAHIRYLNDDGTFGTDATTDEGIFVILAPSLAEVFQVEVDGAVVGGGTAGSANGAIFTLIVNAG